MKKYNFFPLILLIYLPLWYSGKFLQGSLINLYNICQKGAYYQIFKEIFFTSYEAIFVAILFFLFVRFFAPKLSLFISSLFLVAITYLFLPISFFYDNLGIFLIITSLALLKKNQSQHLFFSLFFLTLLHCFSSFLISIHYYGHNTSLLFAYLSPITAFYLLVSKKIYPSKITLLSLFPILLFPISYYTHNALALSIGSMLSIISSTLAIYILLEKKNISIYFITFAFSGISLFFLEKVPLFPFIFTTLSLFIGIIQLFYANYYRSLSHNLSSQHPKQLSLPPLHFHNDHMHY